MQQSNSLPPLYFTSLQVSKVLQIGVILGFTMHCHGLDWEVN